MFSPPKPGTLESTEGADNVVAPPQLARGERILNVSIAVVTKSDH